MSFSIVGKVAKFDTAQDIEPYLKELENIDVQEISLGGNSIGVDAAEALAKVLATKKNLRVANLDDIFTGRLITEIPQALEALCSTLAKIDSLVELNLNDNAFGGRSVQPIVDFLSEHTNLEVLRLNNNGLGPAGGAEIAKSLVAGARRALKDGKSHPLRVLVCGRNRLEDGSSKAWAEAFENLPNLEEIHMPQDGIRPDGLSVMLLALARRCPKLRIVDFQDNTATMKGSRALAAGLRKWPDLEEINMNDCLLRPKGSDLLIEQLKHVPKLQYLRIQANEMEPYSVKKLTEFVKSTLTNIRAVEVNGNRGDPDLEIFEELRAVLAARDAELDEELDEMEEEWEDEEDEEDEDEEDDIDFGESSADENIELAKHDAKLDAIKENTQEPQVTKNDEKDSDDLAKLLEKVEL